MDIDDLRQQLRSGELYAETPKDEDERQKVWNGAANPNLSMEEFVKLFKTPPTEFVKMFAEDVAKGPLPSPKSSPIPGALCQHCSKKPAYNYPSMTAYHWNGEGDDPNKDLTLCKECGTEHTENMQEQRDDYYGDKL